MDRPDLGEDIRRDNPGGGNFNRRRNKKQKVKFNNFAPQNWTNFHYRLGPIMDVSLLTLMALLATSIDSFFQIRSAGAYNVEIIKLNDNNSVNL